MRMHEFEAVITLVSSADMATKCLATPFASLAVDSNHALAPWDW
jgi:hypothetical protein